MNRSVPALGLRIWKGREDVRGVLRPSRWDKGIVLVGVVGGMEINELRTVGVEVLSARRRLQTTSNNTIKTLTPAR